MSRDIRSFFTVKKSLTSKSPAAETSTSISKRKAIVTSSDEESSTQNNSSPKKTTKKRRVIYSDDEDDPKIRINRNNKPNLKKLKSSAETITTERKLVDVSDILGREPVKRVDQPKPKVVNKTLTTEEFNNHFNDDFDLIEAEKLLIEPKLSPQKTLTTESPKTTPIITKPSKESNIISKKIELEFLPNTPTAPNHEKLKSSVKRSNTNSDTDEDRHEKKRLSAILYQQYKNRKGPANPGSKEIPKGKPNCLAGMLFVLTGIYESLDREEAADLIKVYGGKISTSLSKKTNYIVVGDDAGPAKLAKADELRISVLSEDGLLDLIRKKCRISTKNDQSVSTSNEKLNNSSLDVKKKIDIGDQKIDNKKTPKLLTTPDKLISPRKVDYNLIKTEKSTSPNKSKIIDIKKENVGSNIKREKLEDLNIRRDISEHEKNITSIENQAWVDKYKPTSVKQIIGQQGAASNCVKLLNWLTKWHSNHDGKKKLQRPNPWAKNDDGAFYKAALLSGPPGVGKTTTATLVCKELGYDTVEFNASDTRSKKLLKEEVSELLSNKSLYGYFHGNTEAISTKHVLLMDEVDGMAGNEDRGGMQELISLIKDSSVPVICMCNDRNHQKIRSLVNYCYDLRFNRPRLEQIKGAMLSICFKEQMKLAPSVIEEIISATNNDIRQTLNHLTLFSAQKSLPMATKTQDKINTAKKDLKLGPWDVVRKVFSFEEHKNMTLYDKSDLFFNDYSLGPLFVQQNYLSVAPKVPKSEVSNRVALAADSLSLGDLVENRIRSRNAWSMLPVQAMYSSVLPGEYMAGHFTGQINFPGWLGKNSKSKKRSRLAQELHDHTRLRTSGSRLSIRLDYASFLLQKIIRPLKENGLDGVNESLAVIKEYRLLREDIESLIELTTWPGQKNPMDSVESKVKAALTRAYNKEVTAYTYTATAAIKKQKSEKNTDELEGYGDEEGDKMDDVSEEEDNDNLDNDVLIKAKKKLALKTTTKKVSNDKGNGKMKAGPSNRAKAGGKTKSK